jgi:hypothetical protein
MHRVTAEMLDLAFQRSKIDAIKAYREATGLSLKESKDAIEDAMDRDPRMAEIRRRNREASLRSSLALFSDEDLRIELARRAGFARRVMGGEPGGGQ